MDNTQTMDADGMIGNQYGEPLTSLPSTSRSQASERKNPYNAETDDEVEHFSKRLKQQIRLNNIQESLRLKNLTLLRKALTEYDNDKTCEVEEDGEAEQMVAKAREKLNGIEQFLKRLKDASDNRNREEILECLSQLNSMSFRKYILKEERDAQQQAENLKKNASRFPILMMDRKTMAELSSYAKPLPVVLKVMQGALLLLGEDEDTTSNWKKCQSFCHPDGRNGMSRRMIKFDASRVNPFIIERARHLLSDIPLTDVKKASPGAATFFVWAIGIIKKQDEDRALKDDMNRMTYANIIKKETEIFAREREEERTRDRGVMEDGEIYLEELNLSPSRRRRQIPARQSKPYYNAIYS